MHAPPPTHTLCQVCFVVNRLWSNNLLAPWTHWQANSVGKHTIKEVRQTLKAFHLTQLGVLASSGLA